VPFSIAVTKANKNRVVYNPMKIYLCLGACAQVLIWLTYAAEVVMQFFVARHKFLNSTIYPNWDLTRDAAIINVLIFTASLLFLSLLIASSLYLFIWLFHTSIYYHKAGAYLKNSPGWAVAWWFIPVMSLFRPYQVLVELWKAGDTNQDKNKRDDQPSWIFTWWIMCVVASVFYSTIGRFVNRIGEHGFYYDEILVTFIFLLSNFFRAYLFYHLIQRFTARTIEHWYERQNALLSPAPMLLSDHPDIPDAHYFAPK
jgi:hypothetical protein